MKKPPSSYVPMPAAKALKELGENIRRGRKLRNLSMEQCSQRAGITRVTLARLENGSPGVSLSTLARVLWVLGECGCLAKTLALANDELTKILIDRRLPKYIRQEEDEDF